MTSTTMRVAAYAGAFAALVACGGEKDKMGADTTMARDLALAGADSAAKPALTDVPKAQPTAKAKTTSTKAKAPAPVVTAPAAAPPARPTTGAIAAGTSLSLRAASEICTNNNKVGDTFTATVADPVSGSNGSMIPPGAVVTFTITKLNRSENVNDPIEMIIVPKTIAFGGKTYDLDATTNAGFAVDKVRATTKSTDAKKVVGGAVIGAIAGQVAGKNTKSTVIGAAAGAAAGGAAAAATANYEGCLRTGTTIAVTLGNALTVNIA